MSDKTPEEIEKERHEILLNEIKLINREMRMVLNFLYKIFEESQKQNKSLNEVQRLLKDRRGVKWVIHLIAFHWGL